MSEYNHNDPFRDLFLSRRQLLGRMGNGFAALGMMGLLGNSALAGTPGSGSNLNPLAPKLPPLRPRAKRVIFLFMNGGPSHVDTFDPKPALQTYAGKEIPLHLPTERK